MIKDKDGKVLGYTHKEILEMYKQRDKWEKEHPVLNFIKKCLWIYPVHRIPYMIKEFRYKILYFFQRMRRGFSDYDYFDTGSYICDHLAKVLQYFAENTNGYPGDTTYEEFTSKIKRIANAFKAYNEFDEQQTIEENENINAYITLKTISEEEYLENSKAISQKYEEKRTELCKIMGELFEDCFISKLWD